MPDPFQQRTIRESLVGYVSTYFNDGSINCGLTQQVGSELVARLAAYREEERKLYPQVFLIGPSDEDTLKLLAPGSKPLFIGNVAAVDAAGARQVATAALKNCAALAIEGWCVYVRRVNGGFDFGLFRGAAESYSAGAEEALAVSKLPAVLLRHSAENTVELIDGHGTKLEISLTTATQSTKPMSRHVDDFATVACSDVPGDHRVQATGYMARLLTDCLRGGHGALLASIPTATALDRAKFSDGVVLGEPIPLVQTMISAVQAKTAADATLLRSQESLLRGMIESDGVTVFGTDGSIRAFRIIVQQTGANQVAAQPVSGGARSRAFAVLRGYVGLSLKAALFRSQDGRMEVVVQT
ncbi:hypothetical protein R5W23_003196 [Gemmata sp. JC673]|uniref:Uncharacterized protein n=1 Tax=Gemmata algarum TaxID=2975278 RepID=A0ABU5F2F6_9BACT|nr:hypothetical protein [Gemmata algarum]MDY3561768.1 hypothetical protein [Gemmata algarum]